MAKQILKYLKNTKHLCIRYCCGKGILKLSRYMDSDWGGSENCRSMSEYILLLVGRPVSWLSKRQQWPHLTALALNVYSVAVMSDEPERVFSITGRVITPQRRCLEGAKVASLMCLKQWVKAGVLVLDR